MKPLVLAILESEKETGRIDNKQKLTIQKWKTRCENLKKMLTERKKLRQQYQVRQVELEKWKISQKAFLLESEASKISSDQLIKKDFDNQVLVEFMKQNLDAVDSKSELEDMLGFYVEKIAKRENNIQSSYGEYLQVNLQIDQVEKVRASLEEQLFEHDHEYHSKRTELKQILTRTKAISQLTEERRNDLEFKILKKGEENFEEYIGGNEDVFTVVKKTYGAKISQKMKREQREEFISVVKGSFQKRRDDMEEIHYAILAIDKQLDECDSMMNGGLPKMIAEAERLRQLNEERLEGLNQHFEAYVIAESEIIN